MADSIAPSKILIVLTGSLGDVVRGLSILAPLHNSNPSTQVDWVIDSRWVSLIEDHPLINRLIVLPRGKSVSWQQRLNFWRQLRRDYYDYVLDLQRILKSALISKAARSRVTLGFNQANSKEGNYLWHRQTIAPADEDRINKIDHYHYFLDHLNIKSEDPYQFGLDSFRGLSGGPVNFDEGVALVGIVMESSWQSKNLPLEHYRTIISSLAEQLRQRGGKFEILLLGTAAVSEFAQKLQAENTGVRSLAGQTSLRELTAIIAQTEFCIGPDSGPGHIAAALSVRYYTLFGPTRQARVSPYGMSAFNISAQLPCSGCSRRACPGLDNLCMELLTANYVLPQIDLTFRPAPTPASRAKNSLAII